MSPTPIAALQDQIARAYGPNAEQQLARYANAQQKFRAIYGPGPVQLFRAPGRVNIIGEHTDYNHGFVLPAALDKDVVALVRPRPDQIVRAANSEEAYASTEFELSTAIPTAPRGHWSNYVRGPAQMLASRGPVSGADMLFVGAEPYGVPRRVGLSSSSAMVVATAIALAHPQGIDTATPAFAHLCADAEWYVGTRGGIMDHFAALLTQRDHALFLDCRPNADGSYRTRHIPFPSTHRLLVVDSGVHHDNIRGEFNLRVAACRAGVALLSAIYPAMTHLRDVQDVPWQELEAHLPEVTTARQLAGQSITLGDIPGLDADAPLRVRANCRHVWHENARVLATLDALEVQEIARVGTLLNEAHASACDDYAISTPELDFLVETANSIPGVAGARLTGAGWGGCVLILVDADAEAALSVELGAAYAARFGHSPSMFLCQAAPGAQSLGTVEV